MKNCSLTLPAIALTLLVAHGARGDISGSTVTMTSPEAAPNPLTPTAIMFEFVVEKDILFDESIVHVWIELPYCMRPRMNTTFYEEIEPGRPDFVATLVGGTVIWVEQDPIEGGIHRGEATNVGFVGMFASVPVHGVPLLVEWWLVGNLGDDCTGIIPIPDQTPVLASSWGSIKALYDGRSSP
jgi:hypothetical protein